MNNDKLSTKNIIINDSFVSWGLFPLFFMFSIVVFSTFCNFFYLSIGYSFFYIPLFFTITFFCFFYHKSKHKLFIFYSIIFLVAFVFISIYSNSCSYGFDYDGNWYHKFSIGVLKLGWNPIYESSFAYADYFQNIDISNTYLWADSYGKSAWQIAASIYYLTGNIETGKAYNILAMFSLFFISFDSITNNYKLDKNKSILLAIAFTLNPVSIVQTISFGVDGFLFSMLFILWFGLTNLYFKHKIRDSYIIVFCSFILLSNIKFTGLFFGGIFCITFYLLITLKNRKDIFQTILKEKFLLIYFIILAIFSIFFVGYPTYVKNFFNHGSPLWPILGKDSIDIVSFIGPSGFKDYNGISKFIFSILGERENLLSNSFMPTLKIPFTFYHKEFATYAVDTTISGFGVFFSGVFIISFVLFILNFRNPKRELIITSIVCILLIVSVDVSWLARYTPYVYLFAIINILSCLNSKINFYKILSNISLFFLLFNNFCLVNNVIEFSIGHSFTVYNELNNKKNKNLHIKVTQGDIGKIFNLSDSNITYVIDNDIKSCDFVFGICVSE